MSRSPTRRILGDRRVPGAYRALTGRRSPDRGADASYESLLDQPIVERTRELRRVVTEPEVRVAVQLQVPADELQGQVDGVATAAAGRSTHLDLRRWGVHRSRHGDPASTGERQERLRV